MKAFHLFPLILLILMGLCLCEEATEETYQGCKAKGFNECLSDQGTCVKLGEQGCSKKCTRDKFCDSGCCNNSYCMVDSKCESPGISLMIILMTVVGAIAIIVMFILAYLRIRNRKRRLEQIKQANQANQQRMDDLTAAVQNQQNHLNHLDQSKLPMYPNQMYPQQYMIGNPQTPRIQGAQFMPQVMFAPNQYGQPTPQI